MAEDVESASRDHNDDVLTTIGKKEFSCMRSCSLRNFELIKKNCSIFVVQEINNLHWGSVINSY